MESYRDGREAWARFGLVALVSFVVLSSYVLVHECGHAIAGFVFGGTLTGFDISIWDLNAHVSIEGDFALWQQSVISASGVGFPLLLWLLSILLVPRRTNVVYEWVKVIASLAVINTLVPWIVIPVLYIANVAPGDDSTDFLQASSVPPLAVAGIALAMYIGCWALFLFKSNGIDGLKAAWNAPVLDIMASESKRSLQVIIAVGVAVLLLAGTISYVSGR